MRGLAAVAAALLLAGCTSEANEKSTPDTADGLAKAIGSQGCAVDKGVMLVKQQVTCDDGSVIVMTFPDQDGRDAYLDATDGMGGDPQLVGDTWVIESSAATLKDAKAEVGGEIKGS